MTSKVEIRVLSVRQPHADNIIFGPKWCENRSWRTHYRGPVFIHATKWDRGADTHTPGDGVVGAIIGRINIVDVVDLDDVGDQGIRQAARRLGLSTRQECMQHVFGNMCWILTNPRSLRSPIPVKGRLGIWKCKVSKDQLRFARR